MSKKMTFSEFLEKAKEIHGDKFQYDESTFNGSHKRMRVICPIHGEFWIEPRRHLKYDCMLCAHEKIGKKNLKTTDWFIERAVKIHGNEYDYSKVEYKGTKCPVEIICKKHGSFFQVPNDHLSGKGCPICKISKMEKAVKDFLESHGIKYTYQYRAKELGKMSIDFYLTDSRIAIECQGVQHFGKGIFVKNNEFKNIIERDCKKSRICEQICSKLIYLIPYSITEKDFILDIYNNNNTFHFGGLKNFILENA